MSKVRNQPKRETKTKKRGSSQKRKGSGASGTKDGGSGGGGGGVLMSLRGGFQKAGRAATGTGKSKPASRTGKIFNYVITAGLFALLAYIVYTRFIQGG